MLPPGPKAPVAIQTYEWVARPTALLRRCQARYGEPFTLRTAWADAPVVLVSDPAEVRRVFTADSEVVRAGASSTFLEPFAGSHSILVLDGAEHLRQRRLMLPPLHGERMLAHRALVGQIASAEVARWAPGRALRTHPRMQSVALEVMMRAVFGLRAGAELVHVRAAIRRALDMTTSLPRLFALSLASTTSARAARGGRSGARSTRSTCCWARSSRGRARIPARARSCPCCSPPGTRTAAPPPTRSCATSSWR